MPDDNYSLYLSENAPQSDNAPDQIAMHREDMLEDEIQQGRLEDQTLLPVFRNIARSSRCMPPDIAAATATLMILRWLESIEEEARAIAEFEGDNFQSIIEPSHAMGTWAAISGTTLRTYLETVLVPELKSARNGEYATIAHRIAEGIEQLSRFDDKALWDLADVVSRIDPSTPSGRASGARFLDAVLEWMVKESRGHAGEFHSPHAITNLMVTLADPAPGERVYDPCFGTGRLLAEAAQHKMRKAKTTDADAWSQIRRNGIYGREINPSIYLLGLARIVYQGVDLPRLEIGNSLEAESFDGRSNSGFDCILANPPFGTKARDLHHDQFPIKMKDGDGLFIQHIIQSLRPGGRAVVLVPSRVLFQRGAMQVLRQYLVEKNYLKQVISLPKGILRPYAEVSVNLLVLRRDDKPAPVRFLNLNHVELPPTPPKDFEAFASLTDASTYELTNEELKEKDWDLVVREEATEEVTNEIAELGSIYPDVDLKPLSEIAEIRRGISYRKDQTTESIEEAGENPIRILRVSDIQRGNVEHSHFYLKEDAANKISDGAIIRTGDVLLSINGTIGKASYCSPVGPAAIASSGLALIRAKEETLSAEYLFSLLDSEAFQRLMTSVSRGSSIQSLPVKVLRELPFPVPPINTQLAVAQHAIVQKVDAFAYLRRALAQTEEDPFVTWLEESDGVERIISYAREDIERDRLITIQRGAGSIRNIRNLLAHDSRSGTVTPHFFGWLNMLSDAAVKLTSIASVQNQVDRFNFLHNAAVQCMASAVLLPNDNPTLEKRASLLTRSLQRLLEREVDEINSQQRIEFQCDVDVLPDVISEVPVTILNHGPLPLRDIEIRDEHSVNPSEFIPYLPPGESHQAVVQLFTADADESGGHFTFGLVVTGKRMNDEDFEFLEAVSARIIEREDYESREAAKLDAEWAMRQMEFERSGILPDAESSDDLVKAQAPAEQETRIRAEVVVDDAGTTSSDLGYSPYTAGTPVPKKMFGRKSILNRITRQVSNEGQANVILLEGNRRTGKTSLLERLGEGDLTPNCITVYVDCQEGDSDESLPGLPTAEVWRSIAMAVTERLIESGLRSPDFTGEKWIEDYDEEKLNEASREAFQSDHPYETFKRFLSRALGVCAPKRLVLMLDEFDKLQEGVENGITSPSVFQNIRHLVHTHHDLSLILAGTPLLKHLREQHWSALYGFGISVKVSFLSEKDARDLITEPVKGKLEFSESAIKRLIETTNGQPYLIQSLCNTVFLDLAEEGSGRTVSIKNVDDAIREMAESGGHFRDLWNFAGTERRRLLLALAQRKLRSGGLLSRSAIMEELTDLGIALPKDERIGTDLEYLRDLELLKLNKHSTSQHYTLLIPIFGEWIEENEDYEDVVDRAVIESENHLS